MATAKGKFAQFISDRSGIAFPYLEMQKEWNGSRVHNSEFEEKHPQLKPSKHKGDAEALQNPRPDRTETAVPHLLGLSPFATTASDATITVKESEHGRSTSDTVRFRDALGVGGLSESVINSSSGYTITKVDDDFYTFEATSTPTTSETGGGIVASAGPVTVTD